MQEFNILKKNRKYFAATTGGHKCRVVIDSNSENLDLGIVNLVVDDISVRSKYGTDLIFKLSCSAEEQKEAGVCTLTHFRYNSILVKRCRDLGGKWDKENRCWVFSSIVEDKVEELDDYYNSTLVPVSIHFKEEYYGAQCAASVHGYTICEATGRDTGAKMPEGVSLVDGKVSSGGSAKNWASVVEEGSTIRMLLPIKVYEEIVKEESENFLIVKI